MVTCVISFVQVCIKEDVSTISCNAPRTQVGTDAVVYKGVPTISLTGYVTCAQKHDAKSFSGLNYGQKASVKIWWNLEHCRVSLWQYLILALKPIGNGLAGQKCQSHKTCRHASKV